MGVGVDGSGRGFRTLCRRRRRVRAACDGTGARFRSARRSSGGSERSTVRHPSIGFTCSTTRCTERTSWPPPMRGAERTAERREWTARRSERLSRGAGSRDSGSCRRSSGTSAIEPPRYAGRGWTRPTEGNGPWASRRFVTGWCRWRRCWCWSLSSRLTCGRSSTYTEPATARTTRFARCTGWRSTVTVRWSRQL